MTRGAAGSAGSTLTIALASLLVAGACKADRSSAGDRKTGTAQSETGAGAANPTAAPAEPSARETGSLHRRLADEPFRAEISVQGLHVDLGTPDQSKYTRGDWHTGWGPAGEGRLGTTYATMKEKSATLEVSLRRPATEVVIRARAKPRGKMKRHACTLKIDGRPAGRAEVGTDWQVLRFPVAPELGAGSHRLVLGGGLSQILEVDWVWFPEAGAPPEPALRSRLATLRVRGESRSVFLTAQPRVLSYYLDVPAKAELVFDYGADPAVRFSVRIQEEGQAARTVFSESPERGQWKEARVDLGSYAGRVVRLDLMSEGRAAGRAGFAEPEIRVPSPPAERLALPSPAPKNLLVILIDTLRADASATFARDPSGARPNTPAMERIAARSTVFTHAYNNENWTKPSVATTLTGLYPSTHDTKKDPSVLPKAARILPELLSGQSFQTAGFVANGFISGKFGFERGWDKFRNYIRENRKSDAEYVYRDALAWLDKRDQTRPFFLYIQTIDPHVIYRVDRKYTRPYFDRDYAGPLGSTVSAQEQVAISSGKLAVTDTDRSWLRALYFGEVSYHDEHMGRFWDELERRGVLDDTLVVITNDHGEELGDHARYGHGHSLYEELIRAPLMFHYKGAPGRGRRVEHIVENVDVVPTVLDWLGLEHGQRFDGESLLDLVRGERPAAMRYAISEFMYHERAVRIGKWKLIRAKGGKSRLYDLEADGLELHNVAKSHPLVLRWCEIALNEGLAHPDKSARGSKVRREAGLTSENTTIEGELADQLKALGYLN